MQGSTIHQVNHIREQGRVDETIKAGLFERDLRNQTPVRMKSEFSGGADPRQVQVDLCLSGIQLNALCRHAFF